MVGEGCRSSQNTTSGGPFLRTCAERRGWARKGLHTNTHTKSLKVSKTSVFNLASFKIKSSAP